MSLVTRKPDLLHENQKDTDQDAGADPGFLDGGGGGHIYKGGLI